MAISDWCLHFSSNPELASIGNAHAYRSTGNEHIALVFGEAHSLLLRLVCSVFVFQEEDGIRDDLVTGVQTCALPISLKLNKRLGVTDPTGMMYVLDQDYAAVKSGQRAAEPLVLRANAGECVHVELINEFDVNSDVFTQFDVAQNGIVGVSGGSPYGGGTADSSTGPTANYGTELFTSQTAGLHPH